MWASKQVCLLTTDARFLMEVANGFVQHRAHAKAPTQSPTRQTAAAQP